jgi:hypothetical protein
MGQELQKELQKEVFRFFLDIMTLVEDEPDVLSRNVGT